MVQSRMEEEEVGEYESKRMMWNGNELVFSDNPRKGIAGISPGEPDALALEIVARWNAKSSPSENLCERCRLAGPDCPARESAGNFAYALACVWYSPRLELVRPEGKP